MSLTLLPPLLPIKVYLWHISCALPAMNRRLPAELKFRENNACFMAYLNSDLSCHWFGWERWDQTYTEATARCAFTCWCPISSLWFLGNSATGCKRGKIDTFLFLLHCLHCLMPLLLVSDFSGIIKPFITQSLCLTNWHQPVHVFKLLPIPRSCSQIWLTFPQHISVPV